MQPFTFFISYRRRDTAPLALLLKYELEKRLQFVRVSVDVEEIQHGMDFPIRIRQLIEQAHATIVLIGKNWMPRRAQTASRSTQSADLDGPMQWDRDCRTKGVRPLMFHRLVVRQNDRGTSADDDRRHTFG